MKSYCLSPLLVFRVIANRAGVPSGLLADIGSGTDAAILAALEDAQAPSLAAEFPCFYRSGLNPVIVDVRW